MEDNYLLVGTIIATRGLKGVVKIKSSTNFADKRYKKGNKLYLYNAETKEQVEVNVATHSGDNAFDYVSFTSLEDINLVEKYIGYGVRVSREEIPALPKDTYFFADLCKCDVIDEQGKLVGKVIKVEEFTAQLSLRVALPNKKAVLIPYVKYFIKKVDMENHTITCNIIPGLVD